MVRWLGAILGKWPRAWLGFSLSAGHITTADAVVTAETPVTHVNLVAFFFLAFLFH